jgi:hypothetical protein
MANRLNKKGQDLSIGTLILIVLGVIVLVLLVLGFSIGWTNLWEKINIFGGSSSVGDVVTACNLAISSQDKFTQCQKSWDIKLDGKDTKVYCRHSLISGSLNNQVSGCSPAQSKSLFTSACTNLKGSLKEATSCDDGTTQVTIDSLTLENTLCCKKA